MLLVSHEEKINSSILDLVPTRRARWCSRRRSARSVQNRWHVLKFQIKNLLRKMQ